MLDELSLTAFYQHFYKAMHTTIDTGAPSAGNINLIAYATALLIPRGYSSITMYISPSFFLYLQLARGLYAPLDRCEKSDIFEAVFFWGETRIVVTRYGTTREVCFAESNGVVVRVMHDGSTFSII